MSDLAVLRRLASLAKPWRNWMTLAGIAACVTALASFGLMAVAGWFIAAMAIAGITTGMMNYFLPAAGIRFFAILRTGGRYSDRLLSHEATFRLLAGLRIWLFRQLEPLAPAALEDRRGADLAGRLQSDVDTLQHAYLRLGAPLVVAAICVVLATCILVLMHPASGIATLVLLVVAGALIPALAYTRAARPGEAVVAARAELRVEVADLLQGSTDLRVAGALPQRLAQIDATATRLTTAQRSSAIPGALSEAALAACAGLALWVAALLASSAVAAGSLAPALAPALALAAFASFEAIAPMPAVAMRWSEVAAAARRVFWLADRAPAVPPTPASLISPTPNDAGLSMTGIRLVYNDKAEPAINGLDLSVASGETIAILGESGAGKSSIARILQRFWDYEGSISFGGFDLRQYQTDDLRKMIGVAEQNPQLFNASVRYNLAIAAPDAGEEAMWQALRAAQLHDYVASLPEGLDSWVGEGGQQLSAGLARRLVIARTLLRKPRLLILDEPTENLDAGTAENLLTAVLADGQDRTTIIITHDVGVATRFAQRAVRIAAGKITS